MINKMVAFEAITWEARDVDDEHTITIFGRTSDSKSVSVTTAFRPYFFIRLPQNINESGINILFNKIVKVCGKNAPKCFGILSAKDLWGFQNNEKMPAMKSCDSKLRYALPEENKPLRVYESNVEPLLRFMHRTGIQSTGWLETGDNCIRANLTRCNIDLFCNDWKTLKPIENDTLAPFVVASFDIETNSSTGKFPDPDIEGDCVFQIAITLRRLGNPDIYDKTCLCYKKTSPVEGYTITSYDTEKDLLLGFRDYVIKHDIDILTGWNIFGFDLEFLAKRAMMTGCTMQFMDLSKLKDHTCDMVYKKLSSNALGDNILKTLPMAGRYIFDLFHDVKREKQLDSYSLNFVSEKFLGDRKLDMSPKEMFKRFEEGDPDKLAEVAKYCIQDTLLPHRLLDKLCNLLNLLEMAKATWVPIQYLTERGQQIKVFSQMTRKARELGYMVPTIRWGSVPSEGYEGATVLEAQTGAYYAPITALDFEGLYPSIMIAHNLCYSTLVLDPKYDNVPGITYEQFGEHKFAQDVPSLLPAVLRELKAFRKKAKADMANATGSMKAVYNGKQLAYKISMNSVYGFTGAGKGMLPCVPIASTVTMKGRNMIETTKNYVEANFPGAKVRYGDSVTEDTGLLLKINGLLTVKRIDELQGSPWMSDGEKEFSNIQDVETWTERGWTAVKTIIRHKTDKPILRITTHTGSVKVTSDHSLVRKDGSMVKPTELIVGDELLHSFPTTFDNLSPPISNGLARLYGFFLGDGSCGYYSSCDKSSWQLNNADLNLLNEYRDIILTEFPNYECKIYDTMKSSGVYKLNLNGQVKKFALEWSSMFYTESRNKKIPDCILNASKETKEAFLRGLYDADGDKVGPGTRIDQNIYSFEKSRIQCECSGSTG
jgi:DNA polymerase elongation subunit (family B)